MKKLSEVTLFTILFALLISWAFAGFNMIFNVNLTEQPEFRKPEMFICICGGFIFSIQFINYYNRK